MEGDTPGPSERLGRFRRWGRRFFLVLAAFVSVVGILVLPAATAASAAVVGIAFVSVALSIALSTVLVSGLGRGSAWADHATVMTCVVLLTTGLLRVVLSFARGTIDIPIDAIGSAMVLSVRPPSFDPLPASDQWRVTLVVVVAVIVGLSGLLPSVA